MGYNGVKGVIGVVGFKVAFRDFGFAILAKNDRR
jgi:hypothetical protein